MNKIVSKYLVIIRQVMVRIYYDNNVVQIVV